MLFSEIPKIQKTFLDLKNTKIYFCLHAYENSKNFHVYFYEK
jgi:hypothetical protein